jgi:putative ABC transport system permease protein
MANNRFRFAWRTLTRHKGYTFINILGLALGLSACLVIYTIVSYEFSFDRSLPDRDRVYRVGAHIREDHGNGTRVEGYGENIPAPAPEAIHATIPLIETTAAFYPYRTTVSIPAEPFPQTLPAPNTIITTKDYFDIFPNTWLAGSASQSLAQPYGVVLTATRARDYFGDRPAAQYVNREIIYADSLRMRVTGIIKDYKGNTDFPYTDFISFSTISHSFLKNTYRHDSWHFNPGVPGICAFIKLPPHVRSEQDTALLNALVQRNLGTDAFMKLLDYSLVLQPFSDIHFNEGYTYDGIRKAQLPALYGLIAAALFILFLAIVNFINLSTAQALQQEKDTGIRRILGATRFQLITRSLTETFLLTVLSMIIALALVRPILLLFRDYIPAGLSFNPFSPAIILFTVTIIICTTLLAGLYPAVSIARPQLIRNQPSQQAHGRKWTLRSILIVFQFSISLLFIIASLVVGRQLNYMLTADMGFKSDAVLTTTNFGVPPQQLRSFARKALTIPGVQEYTLQGHAPAGMPGMEFPIQLDNSPNNKLEVGLQAADYRFIPFYQLKLLAGRNLLPGDSLREFVINATYSNALGFAKPADALRHFLTWQGETHPIVGVVADFHTSSLHSPIPALAIARVADLDNSIGFRISLADHHTLPRLETLWKASFPGEAFTYTFLDESIAGLYKSDRQLSWLVHLSTIVAIFISCIGLLGLILFVVERKKKEISIRKVLGAGVADIVFLLNKEFMVLIGVALVIASPVAFAGMHHWLQNFAYRIPISGWTFVIAGGITLVITSLTISLRVIRAALVNPTENLRSE